MSATHTPPDDVAEDVGVGNPSPAAAAAPAATPPDADDDVEIDDDPWADAHDDELDAHAVEASLGGVLGADEREDSAKPPAAHAEAEPEAEGAAPERVPLPPDDDGEGKSELASADDAAAHAPRGKEPETEEKQCRICLGGVEDEEEMGRLISPCLCTGSMRHVHVKCINQWRGTGPNAVSGSECPQCSHQYRIQRTLIFGLATSKKILALVTLVLFTFLTLVAGQVLLRILLASLEEANAAKKAAQEAVARGDPAPDPDDESSGGPAIFVFGAGLMYDVIMEAVDTFLDILMGGYRVWGRGRKGWVANAVMWFLFRFMLGIAALGSLSFLSLLISLSLFAPLQLVHTFRGTGIFDGLRNRLRGRGYLIVVAMVLIGVFNSIVQVYDVVQAVTMTGLQYVETQILEVNADAPAERQAPPTWRQRWLADRRWRTMQGWYEVLTRFWLWLKESVRAWRAATQERVRAGLEHGGTEVAAAG
ncbi:hypothetical protein VHUM_04033 [Vanrija humicola]|uniref:Uncharacterized protein n=1 Tax=Vanrija humicola TaxID=5417 RepID=A0A7D8UWR2_VANHU|nr:hypothetical protein VHUM_04033 [Vanrija humicola]